GKGAGGGMARKGGGRGVDGIAGAVTHAGRTDWINGVQLLHALTQPRRIKLVDRKGTDAALGASWTANQPRAALLCGFGQRLVHDLDQPLIASGNGARHESSIAHSLRRIQNTHDLRLRPVSFLSLAKGRNRLLGSRTPAGRRSLTRSPSPSSGFGVRDDTSRGQRGLRPLLKD